MNKAAAITAGIVVGAAATAIGISRMPKAHHKAQKVKNNVMTAAEVMNDAVNTIKELDW